MRKLLLLSILLFVTGVQAVFTQSKYRKYDLPISATVCYASEKVEKTYLPPPSEFLLKAGSEYPSTFVVDYSLFPTEAKEAFEYAVNIWESVVQSDVPIYIEANWRTQESNVLGSAGPTTYYTDFKNIPHNNVYYPVSIVERITKTEIYGATVPDISSTFNKDINWYFGTDGNTPDSLYDFVTVALHEIAHGLGFTGFLRSANDLGLYDFNKLGDISAFDLLVVDKNLKQLVDTLAYPFFSSELHDALTSGELFANSPSAIAYGTGTMPRLYAPTEYDDGSSTYHLDDVTHPGELMTYAIGKAEAIHDPGVLVIGILEDIGWKHMYLDFQKPKDLEQIKPIDFAVDVESDHKLDTSSVLIIYSFDNFRQHVDSLELVYNVLTNSFETQLVPGSEVAEINYFIIAEDSLKRVFTLPTEAPEDLYKIQIGPDTEPPNIKHEPIPYFVLFDESLQISAEVEDNLGIDSVYIEYELNGIPQPPFGMVLDSASHYIAKFTFNLNQLRDGDIISYNIVARDSSVAQNICTFPKEDKLYFNIEKVFEPQKGYIYDFNHPRPDFIIKDFDIYTEVNFEDAALHSPHPYPSPKIDNTEWNFTTLLKYPIVLLENSKMTFDEVVLVEPGEPSTQYNDDEFWDYVVIEGSKDSGKTWLPIADGYDSGRNEIWEDAYNAEISGQSSQTEGTSELFIHHEIDMLENENFIVGDTILVRFRLFSDPYANGWGWAIDNLRIQIPVSAYNHSLSNQNISVYPNPFNDVFNLSIRANKRIKSIKIDVFNIYGQKITSMLTKNIMSNFNQEINLKNHGNGLYFITVVENEKLLYSGKVLKK